MLPIARRALFEGWEWGNVIWAFGKKRTQPNILEGSMVKNILVFIFPLIVTNLLQTCYHAADMAIVGRSGVEGAVGAIGITASVINVVLNFFIGISVGATVLVARSIGAGDEETIRKTVHTALCSSILLGLVAAGVGLFSSRPILMLMGTEGAVLDMATSYSRMYFAGAPFMALSNFAISVFRAKGDTQTPMMVLVLSGLSNVLMNLFFVLVCGMNVEGVALATILSQVLSSALLLWLLSRDPGSCRFRPRELKIQKKVLTEILRVGLPAGVQNSLFSISNMLLQSSVISINNAMYPGGSVVLDGNAVGHSLDGFVNQAQAAVHQASVTFTSQHVGAKKIRRIRKVAGCCYLITFLLSVAISGVILLLQRPIVSFYVGSYENVAEVAKIVYLRNSYMLTTYFLLSVMDVGAGVLRGMGKSMTSTVISLLGSCAFRICWILLVLPHFNTLECLYTAYPLSWFLTAVVNFGASVIVWKKLLKQEDPGSPA